MPPRVCHPANMKRGSAQLFFFDALRESEHVYRQIALRFKKSVREHGLKTIDSSRNRWKMKGLAVESDQLIDAL